MTNKNQQFSEEEKPDGPKKATLPQAILVFGLLIVIMSISIIKFELDPHMPMFIGVIIAAVMALHIGYSWDEIERAMIKGINQALPSIMILTVIGILVGVWILSGVVPSMIYYGLMILKPSIFLVASVLICSITSLATGSSWGTVGTMGIALMGIAQGMGIPLSVTAGAIISGAYFGDKMSPLSDTTNLAPAMAGTDVFTHIKAMFGPTGVTYVVTLIIFAIITMRFDTSGANTSAITELQVAMQDNFTISPILLLPPVIVIGAIAFKISALPGITIGIIAAAILGPIFQEIDFGDILQAGMQGYISQTGIESLDSLLTAGGLMGMMFSISLTIIAMMFGGIAEKTGQMEVIVNKVISGINSVTGLVTATILTAILSNITMPEQYISVVIPGRMYAPVYREREFHPKMLSATLEAGGTVSAPLIPWNTCGVYMSSVLKVPTTTYIPFAFFNYLMPIITIILTAMGKNIYYAEDDPDTIVTTDE